MNKIITLNGIKMLLHIWYIYIFFTPTEMVFFFFKLKIKEGVFHYCRRVITMTINILNFQNFTLKKRTIWTMSEIFLFYSAQGIHTRNNGRIGSSEFSLTFHPLIFILFNFSSHWLMMSNTILSSSIRADKHKYTCIPI